MKRPKESLLWFPPDEFRPLFLDRNAAAVKKSRAKNPEAYRAYQREYMRKRRAKATKD